MSRIEGLPPCTLRVFSSERKDGGERHERKNWKLINSVSWHIRRRVKKKEERWNTVQIWMLEKKRNFFFFFAQKESTTVHTLLLFFFLSFFFPFCLASFRRNCSLLARIHDYRGGRRKGNSLQWNVEENERSWTEGEEVGEGRRGNPSLFARRFRMEGRKSAAKEGGIEETRRNKGGTCGKGGKVREGRDKEWKEGGPEVLEDRVCVRGFR